MPDETACNGGDVDFRDRDRIETNGRCRNIGVDTKGVAPCAAAKSEVT
jgi:hypothetical protein